MITPDGREVFMHEFPRSHMTFYVEGPTNPTVTITGDKVTLSFREGSVMNFGRRSGRTAGDVPDYLFHRIMPSGAILIPSEGSIPMWCSWHRLANHPGWSMIRDAFNRGGYVYAL